MPTPAPTSQLKKGCAGCRESGFPHTFSMAFQPIVDLEQGKVFAYEALVRGMGGESAYSVLSLADDQNRYSLDQQCRMKAIELASILGLVETGAYLSINFYPNAVYEPAACLRNTFETASRVNFPLDRLIFEVTEGEKVKDHDHLNAIMREYRARGFKTAIDDFGAGYAGLNLLAKFQPDILKIDAELTRNIDQHPVGRTIVHAVLEVCDSLNIQPIAEGIETSAELAVLQDMGMRYFQGYYFAKPAFEALPECSHLS